MSQTLPLVGAASEPGIALSDAIKKLVKYVPPGTVGPAADQNAMQQLQMRQAQAGPQMAAMRQQAAAPPGAGGGQPPQAPTAG